MTLENTKFTLLTPEEIPKEKYPYRRVWRSVILEIGSIVGLMLIVLIGVGIGFLRDVPSLNWGALLILVPLAVFLYVSVRGEQRVANPREGLLTVTLFSALLANGVGVPLVDNFYEPRLWLSDAGFFSRVLGYAFTYGVTSEFLKYVAIRYTVFPRRIRNRMDGIAYSVAASIGYASILNAHEVLQPDPTVSADAMRLAINFISQISVGIIMGYFIAELALHDRPPFFLGAGLLAGAMMQGITIAFRGIAAGSGYSVSNIRAVLVVLLFAVLISLAINFLVTSLDAREATFKGERRLR